MGDGGRKEEKTLGCALMDDTGIARYFPSLSYRFLFPVKWTAILPHTSCYYGHSQRRPKGDVPNSHALKPPEPLGSRAFLYKFLSSMPCHSSHSSTCIGWLSSLHPTHFENHFIFFPFQVRVDYLLPKTFPTLFQQDPRLDFLGDSSGFCR